MLSLFWRFVVAVAVASLLWNISKPSVFGASVHYARCKNGTYGVNCRSTCNSMCRKGLCDAMSGHCTHGCVPGWIGDNCDLKCPGGHYGQGCQAMCVRCEGEECDHITGHCARGCVSGWTGSMCNIECPFQKGGWNCSEAYCGRCVQGHCEENSGECKNSCLTGWVGKFCDVPCSAGQYGFECSHACSQCVTGCSIVTGNCMGSCPGSMKGLQCNIYCSADNHQRECLSSCTYCHGGLSRCDDINNTCQDGCVLGRTGSDCSKPCSTGFFGLNCKQPCGDCLGGPDSCDTERGFCKSGCSQPGQSLPYCLTPKQSTCGGGMYGPNCDRPCGKCAGGRVNCHPATGTCAFGCQYPYLGDRCMKDPSGRCIVDGNPDCGGCGHCVGGYQNCDSQQSICLTGCEVGWTGDVCMTPCANGTYGANCSLPCQCHPSCECDHVTGQCDQRCLLRVQQSEYAHTLKTLSKTVIIGAAVGAAVASLGIIFLGVLAVRRMERFKRYRGQHRRFSAGRYGQKPIPPHTSRGGEGPVRTRDLNSSASNAAGSAAKNLQHSNASHSSKPPPGASRNEGEKFDSPGNATETSDRSRNAKDLDMSDSLGNAKKMSDRLRNAKKMSASSGKAKDMSDSSGKAKKMSDSSGKGKEMSDRAGNAKEMSDSSGKANDMSDSSDNSKKMSDSSAKTKTMSDSRGSSMSQKASVCIDQSEEGGGVSRRSKASWVESRRAGVTKRYSLLPESGQLQLSSADCSCRSSDQFSNLETLDLVYPRLSLNLDACRKSDFSGAGAQTERDPLYCRANGAPTRAKSASVSATQTRGSAQKRSTGLPPGESNLPSDITRKSMGEKERSSSTSSAGKRTLKRKRTKGLCSQCELRQRLAETGRAYVRTSVRGLPSADLKEMTAGADAHGPEEWHGHSIKPDDASCGSDSASDASTRKRETRDRQERSSSKHSKDLESSALLSRGRRSSESERKATESRRNTVTFISPSTSLQSPVSFASGGESLRVRRTSCSTCSQFSPTGSISSPRGSISSPRGSVFSAMGSIFIDNSRKDSCRLSTKESSDDGEGCVSSRKRVSLPPQFRKSVDDAGLSRDIHSPSNSEGKGSIWDDIWDKKLSRYQEKKLSQSKELRRGRSDKTPISDETEPFSLVNQETDPTDVTELIPRKFGSQVLSAKEEKERYFETTPIQMRRFSLGKHTRKSSSLSPAQTLIRAMRFDESALFQALTEAQETHENYRRRFYSSSSSFDNSRRSSLVARSTRGSQADLKLSDRHRLCREPSESVSASHSTRSSAQLGAVYPFEYKRQSVGSERSGQRKWSLKHRSSVDDLEQEEQGVSFIKGWTSASAEGLVNSFFTAPKILRGFHPISKHLLHDMSRRKRRRSTKEKLPMISQADLEPSKSTDHDPAHRKDKKSLSQPSAESEPEPEPGSEGRASLLSRRRTTIKRDERDPKTSLLMPDTDVVRPSASSSKASATKFTIGVSQSKPESSHSSQSRLETCQLIPDTSQFKPDTSPSVAELSPIAATNEVKNPEPQRQPKDDGTVHFVYSNMLQQKAPSVKRFRGHSHNKKKNALDNTCEDTVLYRKPSAQKKKKMAVKVFLEKMTG